MVCNSITPVIRLKNFGYTLLNLAYNTKNIKKIILIFQKFHAKWVPVSLENSNFHYRCLTYLMYFNHSGRKNIIVPDMWCKIIIYVYKSPPILAKMGVHRHFCTFFMLNWQKRKFLWHKSTQFNHSRIFNSSEGYFCIYKVSLH